MATAEKTPMDYQVVLTLSRDEAETLYDLTGSVIGSPYSSRRKYATNIFHALDEIGVHLPQSGQLGPYQVVRYDDFI